MRRLLVLLGVCALAACGGEHPTEPDVAAPQLALSVNRPLSGPRDTIRVTALVRPAAGDSVRAASFVVAYEDGSRDTIPLSLDDDRAMQVWIEFVVPLAPITTRIETHAVIRTRANEVTDSIGFAIGDDGPPSISRGGPPGDIPPGSGWIMGWTVRDRSGVGLAELRVSGAVQDFVQLVAPTYPRDTMLSYPLGIPATATPGDSAWLVMRAVDLYGRESWDTVYRVRVAPPPPSSPPSGARAADRRSRIAPALAPAPAPALATPIAPAGAARPIIAQVGTRPIGPER